MLKHILKVAVRNFYKNRFYTSINIVCLALGISFCLFTAIYIHKQYEINEDLRNVERQFILKTKWRKPDMGPDITVISMLPKGLKDEYPHIVANYYRFNPVTNVVSAGNRYFQEDIAIGDTTLVSMFGFKLVQGNPANAFTNPGSAVITETLAKKFFDDGNALGKTISIQTTRAGTRQDFTVSAVLADLPVNSVTHVIGGSYSVFLPFTGNQYFANADFYNSWENLDVLGFVELQPGKTVPDLQRSIDQLLRKNSPDFIWKNLTAAPAGVSDYHFKDNNNALSKMILILVSIAVFVLLMVVINFINISIGSSTSRLKEIALKKTFGIRQGTIVQQFLLESLVLTLLATLTALFIYQGLKPLFFEILQTEFPSVWNLSAEHWSYLAILVLSISVMAGYYPAVVLSKINLVNAVKGKLNASGGSLLFRRVLLTIQFSLAIFVFICAINISNQVQYIFTRDTGYQKEQLMIITALPKQWDSAGVARMQTIKQEVLNVPGVKQASIAFEIPDQVPFGKWEVLAPKGSSADGRITLSLLTVDEDYASTLGLKLVAGTFFAEGKDGLVLNESAVRHLGESTMSILGKKVKTIAGGDGITVTGVVKDYNYSSMQERIAPVGFLHLKSNNTYRYLLVKMNPGHIAQYVERVKDKWREMSPNTPFNYSFMDEKFAALYKTELQLQKAAKVATVLNVFIVLLGVIGVVALMLRRKVKEIAIRKVLGAKPIDITLMFLKEYAVLIMLASIVAWPFAYLASEKIFGQFAYRSGQSASSYLLSFMLIAGVSFMLISFQSLRAASANPVKDLKTD